MFDSDVKHYFKGEVYVINAKTSVINVLCDNGAYSGEHVNVKVNTSDFGKIAEALDEDKTVLVSIFAILVPSSLSKTTLYKAETVEIIL